MLGVSLQIEPITVVVIAGLTAAAAIIVVMVLVTRRRAKNKREKVPVKWSALVDWRGLIVEAQGPADSTMVAYIVQSVRVLEELGKLSEMRARVGDLTIEVVPHEEGLYRVVAR